jgi:hypothetical protein
MFSASHEMPLFHGTRRFITAFTRARQLPDQSSPYTNPRLGLQSGLFVSGFPTKSLYAPLLSPIPVTFPDHPLLDLIS